MHLLVLGATSCAGDALDRNVRHNKLPVQCTKSRCHATAPTRRDRRRGDAMKIGLQLPLTAAAVGLALCLATTLHAQTFTMKFGTATVNEPQHEYIKIYKEEIEQRSGGRIKVEIYPQSQLGPIPRQIEGLQLGTIEGFIGPADF